MWLKVIRRLRWLRWLRVIRGSHGLIRTPSYMLSALLSSAHSLQPQGHITSKGQLHLKPCSTRPPRRHRGRFLHLTGQSESHGHISLQRGPGNVVLILCGHVPESNFNLSFVTLPKAPWSSPTTFLTPKCKDAHSSKYPIVSQPVTSHQISSRNFLCLDTIKIGY